MIRSSHRRRRNATSRAAPSKSGFAPRYRPLTTAALRSQTVRYPCGHCIPGPQRR
ncbi:hypothetical protein [Lysobacter gummosus]|uniref:hypothetical protein n=1 Tax=Lysobacter gummosus TaxID=262324 RepID=UPI003627F635